MTERDPRVNPVLGDLLKFKSGITHRVIGRGRAHVVASDGRFTIKHTLRWWRACAVDAEIVEQAK